MRPGAAGPRRGAFAALDAPRAMRGNRHDLLAIIITLWAGSGGQGPAVS